MIPPKNVSSPKRRLSCKTFIALVRIGYIKYQVASYETFYNLKIYVKNFLRSEKIKQTFLNFISRKSVRKGKEFYRQLLNGNPLVVTHGCGRRRWVVY